MTYGRDPEMLGHLGGVVMVAMIVTALLTRDATFAKALAVLYFLTWVVVTAGTALAGFAL